MSERVGPKFSVAGKGGTGKTSISAGLALSLAQAGWDVLAIDGDSNNCLGYALGFPEQMLAGLRPLSEMREELQERAQPGGSGVYLLAPPVADLIDKYSVGRDRLRLLVMGSIDQGGSGCACPLNAALRQLLRELVKRPEAVVVDMEAGVEHLGRGTAAALDTMLLVVEPTDGSIRTAMRIARLAADIGVERLVLVGNKIRSAEELDFIRRKAGELEVIGSVAYVDGLPENIGEGSGPAGQFMEHVKHIADRLLAED